MQLADAERRPRLLAIQIARRLHGAYSAPSVAESARTCEDVFRACFDRLPLLQQSCDWAELEAQCSVERFYADEVDDLVNVDRLRPEQEQQELDCY